MREVIVAVVSTLITLLISIVGLGAVALPWSRKRDSEPEHEPLMPSILQKEEHLEKQSPADIVAASPDPASHERRKQELADAVRERIRNRSREALSRGSSSGTSNDS